LKELAQERAEMGNSSVEDTCFLVSFGCEGNKLLCQNPVIQLLMSIRVSAFSIIQHTRTNFKS